MATATPSRSATPRRGGGLVGRGSSAPEGRRGTSSVVGEAGAWIFPEELSRTGRGIIRGRGAAGGGGGGGPPTVPPRGEGDRDAAGQGRGGRGRDGVVRPVHPREAHKAASGRTNEKLQSRPRHHHIIVAYVHGMDNSGGNTSYLGLSEGVERGGVPTGGLSSADRGLPIIPSHRIPPDR